MSMVLCYSFNKQQHTENTESLYVDLSSDNAYCGGFNTIFGQVQASFLLAPPPLWFYTAMHIHKPVTTVNNT